ncbi:MAG: hypothetical protein AB1792_09690 [Candidatus Zixiibacteriota bacterium]
MFQIGAKSLKLYGQVGGCWGALVNRSYSGLPLFVSMAVRNGSEALSGCHPYRAAMGLRTGCQDWWCCPCPELFRFLANGDFQVSNPDGPTTFPGYDLEVWHEVKCYLQTPGDAKLHVMFWLDGQYLGEFLWPEEPWMAAPAYFDISAQEGSVWYDDVCINPPAACPFTAADLNCDGVASVQDVVLCVNEAFRGAPPRPPCCVHQ